MEPQTIVDTPIPLLEGGETSPLGSSSNPVTNGFNSSIPDVQSDISVPAQNIATDTISESINTETKAILGTFIFEQLGAIRIGQFKQGVSGEIDISPNGILGINVNGDTTFTIDGTTGDATFAGEVQAGAFISGEVIVGDGNIVIDGTNTQINIFDSGDHNTVRLDDTGLIGYNTSGSEIMHLKPTGLEVYGLSGDIFKLSDAAGGTVYGKMGYNASASFNHAVSLYSRGSIQLTNYDGSSDFATIASTLILGVNSPLYQDILLSTIHGNVTINAGGDINVTPSGAFKINGSTKTAIVPSSLGYKALYAIESPNVWFMDFCDNEYDIDPMFLEVTEGEMEFIKTESGRFQVWRKRKGFADTRFEEKTVFEFEQNEKFLKMSQLDN